MSMEGQETSQLSFSALTKEMQDILECNRQWILRLLEERYQEAYHYIDELGGEVTSKYKIRLIFNFLEKDRIYESNMYGRRDLSLIMSMKSSFPLPQDAIKAKASEMLPGCRVEDSDTDGAGIRVFINGEGDIEIFPHSLHVMCTFTKPVTAYCDWLFENVYERNGSKEPGTTREKPGQ